jgi:hypothetical protein
MIWLVVFTDGRDDLLKQTIASADANLDGPITRRSIVDDTGDLEHSAQLRAELPGWGIEDHRQRLGFAGSIAQTWQLLESSSEDPEQFVFHLEDDFIFNRPVDLVAMIRLLNEYPPLAQLALRRQPVNDAEKAAGGVVEMWPDQYADKYNGYLGCHWLEHRLFFTTNASLYRRSLCKLGWPEGRRSEEAFTRRCLDQGYSFGYWGSRDSGEAIHHTGTERAGCGY